MLDALILGFGLLAAALSASSSGREETPIVLEDPGRLFVPPTSVPMLDEPQWIVHRVRPRDSLAKIAARYAVTVADLRAWNHLDLDEDVAKRRRTVRVLARRNPPPPVRVAYVVAAGDSWDDVAVKLRVSSSHLRVTNRRVNAPLAGKKVVAWVDPIEGPTFDPNAKDIEWSFTAPAGGRSVGLPQRGRLENGVQLPPSPLWDRSLPSKLWASSHTITTLHRAFVVLRNEIGYRGTVVIGAMSHEHGRRFRPHRSHQSGRDIDIRLPLKHGVEPTLHPRADDIDWYASWALVNAFIRTGEVETIFLDIGRQSRLFTAARVLGVPRDELDEVVRWPTWKGDHAPIVKHSDGHDTHIHVRIRCAPDEPECRTDG